MIFSIHKKVKNKARSAAYCLSHIGTTRTNHEDNFILKGRIILPEVQKKISRHKNQAVSLFAVSENEVQLFAVSDGMGGHDSGEVASFITVKMLSELEPLLQECFNIREITDLCQKGLNQINRRVRELSQETPGMGNMGATVTLLIKFRDENAVLNLGDSRTYFFDGGSLKQITKDHNEGKRLFDLKLLTREEVEHFPAKNNLYKYIGMRVGEASIVADEYMNPATQRGWFLLCSDGLTSAVGDNEIEDILGIYYKNNQMEPAGDMLLNSALNGLNGRKGSNDNITVMLVQN